MLPTTCRADAEFELAQVDRLLDQYAELFRRLARREPDTVEVAAVASVLHAFYNGVESVFVLIAKGLGEPVSSGSDWHRDLLRQMSAATGRRPAVLSDGTRARLQEFLAFRHFFRHSYTFDLQWPKLAHLVSGLPAVWSAVKADVTVFLQREPGGPGTHAAGGPAGAPR